MNYFLDTEFYEDGERIHLISIGIVREDGRELYIENSSFDWDIVPADETGDWLRENVKWHLQYYTKPEDKGTHAIFNQNRNRFAALAPKETIGKYIERFVEGIKPQFYAYFADYDWVVLCQLYGRMMHLPKGFPFFCMDLKQMMEERGLSGHWKRTTCPDPVGEHNALVDARWNKQLYETIKIHDRTVKAFAP